MIVLSTCVKEPLNGALGVGLGRGVLVGGTSENDVFVGIGVNVGRGVSLGVAGMVGLAVQVGWSCNGVTVNEGTALPNSPPPPGGRRFREEAGLINTSPK